MRRSTYSSLVSYPPQKIYPINKPGDVPKMTPGDHRTYRYSTYKVAVAIRYSSSSYSCMTQHISMLKASCAERWTSAPVRICLHATAPLTVPTAPTLQRLCSLRHMRSEATSCCRYSGRHQGSHGSHTQACSASSALRVITPPNQPSPSRTRQVSPGSLATRPGPAEETSE